jgi:hypothetical protein
MKAGRAAKRGPTKAKTQNIQQKKGDKKGLMLPKKLGR